MIKIKKCLLKLKSLIREVYAFLLCPQECVVCKKPSNSALPICKDCIKEKFTQPLQYRIEHPECFCALCGRFLISEQTLCTTCRAKELDPQGEKTMLTKTDIEEKKQQTVQKNACDKIFAIFPYQDKAGKTLIKWKNSNYKGFAEFFASIVFKFISSQKELQEIPIVPVPPRPKKLKTKGWDQIQDLTAHLEMAYSVKIFRALQRENSLPQKTLSSKERKTNLKGKIHLKNKNQTMPKNLIILDDVMTTGSTLHHCAKALKEAGCKKVYGLCLFFD